METSGRWTRRRWGDEDVDVAEGCAHLVPEDHLMASCFCVGRRREQQPLFDQRSDAGSEGTGFTAEPDFVIGGRFGVHNEAMHLVHVFEAFGKRDGSNGRAGFRKLRCKIFGGFRDIGVGGVEEEGLSDTQARGRLHLFVAAREAVFTTDAEGVLWIVCGQNACQGCGVVDRSCECSEVVFQSRNGEGVVFGYVAAKEIRAPLGLEASGFYDVFDADGHTVQQTEFATADFGIALRCTFESVFRIYESPRIDVRVDGIDPVKQDWTRSRLRSDPSWIRQAASVSERVCGIAGVYGLPQVDAMRKTVDRS